MRYDKYHHAVISTTEDNSNSNDNEIIEPEPEIP